MINYRFYLLNRQNHITAAQVAECDGIDAVQVTALSWLAQHPAAAAVEAWDRSNLVYHSERPTTHPVSTGAA